MMTPAQKRRIWEKTANIAACFVYALFMFASARDFMETHRPSSLLAAVFALVIAHFLLVRPMPSLLNTSPYDWFIALAGTYLPLFLRPMPGAHDFLLTQLMQIAGVSVTVWAAFSLGKSFGLVAVNRGVRTGGIYKYIRHPLYAGYFLQFTAFWAQNMSLMNTAVLLGWMGFEVARIFAEEKFLSRDPAYAAYMQTTRWRIIPYLF